MEENWEENINIHKEKKIIFPPNQIMEEKISLIFLSFHNFQTKPKIFVFFYL